jgi:hypothetical protein
MRQIRKILKNNENNSKFSVNHVALPFRKKLDNKNLSNFLKNSCIYKFSTLNDLIVDIPS